MFLRDEIEGFESGTIRMALLPFSEGVITGLPEHVCWLAVRLQDSRTRTLPLKVEFLKCTQTHSGMCHFLLQDLPTQGSTWVFVSHADFYGLSHQEALKVGYNA